MNVLQRFGEDIGEDIEMSFTLRGTFRNSGQVALLTVILFLFISLAVLGAVTFVSVYQLRNSSELIQGEKSFVNTESGVEDLSYRLSSAGIKQSSASETIPLNGGNVLTSVSQIGFTYTLNATGNVNSRIRKTQVTFKLVDADGLSFASALQAGYVGLQMNNTAQVRHAQEPTKHGNIYSNGSATGSNNNSVTGNITVARPIANDKAFAQVNLDGLADGATSLPAGTQVMKFHDSSAHNDAAQSFIPSVSSYIPQVKLYIKKETCTTYPDISVAIVANDPNDTQVMGKPWRKFATALAYGTLSNTAVSCTTWNWVTVPLPSGGAADRTAIENEKYWLILDIDGSTDYTKIYDLAAGVDDSAYVYGQGTCYGTQSWCDSIPDGNGLYGGGTFKYSPDVAPPSPTYTCRDSVDCTAPNFDIAFQVFMGEKTTDSNGNYTTKTSGINSTAGSVYAESIESMNANVGAYYKNISTPGTVHVPAGGTACVSGVMSGGCHGDPAYTAPNPLFLAGGSNGQPWQSIMSNIRALANDAAGGTDINLGSGTQTCYGPVGSVRGWASGAGGTTISCSPDQVFTGTLNMNASSTLILSGPPYVLVMKGTGAINLLQGGNCLIWAKAASLAAIDGQDAYLIFDGKVNVKNKCKFFISTYGSATPHTGGDTTNAGNIYVVSVHRVPSDTTEPQNTILVQDNVTNGVYFAPRGQVVVLDSVDLTALSAPWIQFRNTAVISYKDGVADPHGVGSTKIPSFTSFHEI